MMGIASFSPLFVRSAGLSALLAPVQAFAALFVPTPAVPVHFRPAFSSVSIQRGSPATNQVAGFKPTAAPPAQRLKVLRQCEPGAPRANTGRMVISGRMADVCAELDRMVG